MIKFTILATLVKKKLKRKFKGKNDVGLLQKPVINSYPLYQVPLIKRALWSGDIYKVTRGI